MSILRYDQKELVARLRILPNRLRVAFAAACAERQFPNYVHFSARTRQGNPDALAGALGRLWDDLEGKPASDDQLRQNLDTCMSLLPDEDSADPDVVYPAEDAVSSIVYAISARLDADLQQAVSAAQAAHDSLDQHVQEVLGVESFGRNEEERIIAHPLIQAEFSRQLADLCQLERLAKHPGEETAGIAELRRRAKFDAQTFLARSDDRTTALFSPTGYHVDPAPQ
jgi:uncharacterized protein YjaG (DUF416 family)